MSNFEKSVNFPPEQSIDKVKEQVSPLEAKKESLESDSELFEEYVEGLRLTPEDFKKKILDVGAGSARFAKWAKEKGISDEVYSLEPAPDMLRETEHSVRAMAQAMPFADKSFDLVVSWAAIPNMFSGIENPKVLHNQIKESLFEELRVTKEGGEIRFGPIGDHNEQLKQVRIALESVLEELKKGNDGIVIQVDRIGSFRNVDEQGRVISTAPKFLVKIKKLK